MRNDSSIDLHGKGVVLVKSTGGAGLGDSVRALLSALHYATVSKRHIAVQWDDGMYGPKGVNAFPRLLQLVDLAVTDLDEVDENDVRPATWSCRLKRPLNELYGHLRDDEWDRQWALANLSFDQRRFNYPERVLVMWDFDGFQSSWHAVDPKRRVGTSPEDAMRRLAKQHLRPSPEALAMVLRICREKYRNRMVGVHVRKTFEKGGTSRHVNLITVFDLVEALLAGNNDIGVFLATDNSEVEVAFRARFPHVVTARKWFGAPGIALHFDERATDKTRLAIEAVIDLYLLASCDWLIHPANSSYSRVAGIIGRMAPECIFPVPPGISGRLWCWSSIRRIRRMGHNKVTREPMPYFLES